MVTKKRPDREPKRRTTKKAYSQSPDIFYKETIKRPDLRSIMEKLAKYSGKRQPFPLPCTISRRLAISYRKSFPSKTLWTSV